MKDIICGIYKIENQINHHAYIGQSTDIYTRWAQHKSDSKRLTNLLLYKAINKYGIQNFSFSIIEECNKEQLNEKEIYWIKYYNTYNDGYNMTIGGQYNNTLQRVATEEEVKQIRQRELNYETFSEVLKDYPHLSEGTFKKIWQGTSYTDIEVEGFTQEAREYSKKVAKRKESASRKNSLMTNELVLQIRIDKKNGMKRRDAFKKYKEYFNSINSFDGIWYNKRWVEIQPNKEE